MRAREFLNREDRRVVTDAIKAAEQRTSGEIRIHIDSDCPGDARERALHSFHRLGMTRTAARNGVLLYVAVNSRKLAVIGDKGINEAVPRDFWKGICSCLSEAFGKGERVRGLCDAVAAIGEKLRESFPYEADDKNELPDDISFGEEDDKTDE